jgi:hypothetical protein
MFKDKIINALKTNYASLGLGDERLGKVADILDATVKEEKDVETAVKADWVNSSLKILQSDNDSVRNENAGLKKQLAEMREKIEGKPLDKSSQPLTRDDIEKLMNEKFDARLKAIDEAKAQAKAKEDAALAKFGELGIDNKFKSVALAYSNIAKDEAEYENLLKTFKQTLSDGEFKNATPPETPEVRIEKENESIAKMIEEGTKKQVELKKD